MTQHRIRRTAPTTAVALLCALALAACGGNDDGTSAGDDTTPSAPSTPTTSAASPSMNGTADGGASPSSPAAVGTTGTLVYYVVETPLGDRLAAERTSLGRGSQLDAALAALGAGKPADPDYRSLVPPKSLSSAMVEDGMIHVDLASRNWATPLVGTSPADARLAIQQVVYTLNAANGTAAKPLPVHFMLGGKASTYLGQPAEEKPGPQVRTLSLMNAYSPVEGQQVAPGVVTFDGVGSSFEATVGWKVLDSSGKAVLKGSTTAAGWMGKLYPWKARVDLSKLPAGSYTFVASTDDASEGEGGGPITDSKDFTLG